MQPFPASTKRNLNLDIRIPIGNTVFNILYINYEAPRPLWHYKLHSHSSYELHFVPSGKGTLDSLDRKYDISPGTLYLTGPGVYHSQTADNSDPMNEFCLNFEIKEIRTDRSKNKTYQEKEIENILQVFQNTTFWIGHDESDNNIFCFLNIFSEFENNMIGHNVYIKSLVTQILINTVRLLSDEKESECLIPKKNLVDSRRYIVDDYFKDIEDTLTAKQLANRIGTSVRQLQRILISYYGMTFHEKLLQTRMEVAKKLLMENLKIQEVAAKTGYENSNYFSTVFKNYFNMSPSAFKYKNS